MLNRRVLTRMPSSLSRYNPQLARSYQSCCVTHLHPRGVPGDRYALAALVYGYHVTSSLCRGVNLVLVSADLVLDFPSLKNVGSMRVADCRLT